MKYESVPLLILTLVIAAALSFVYIGVASGGAPIGAQPCVAVEITLHSYTGPITISDACLSAPATYDGAVLRIEAVDAGDGIFHNGFEVTP